MEGSSGRRLSTKPPDDSAQRRRFGWLDDAMERVAARHAEASVGEAPRRIGVYRITRRLGSGGVGDVYLAHAEPDGSPIALKLLTEVDVEARERFKREADALRQLSHPHVVEVLDVGEADGAPYMAMRYVPGPSLRDTGAIPLADALGLIQDVCEGAHHAHEQGILHRDIKPSNVLIDPERGAQLVDFGLAKTRGADDMTITGMVLGTPAFLSPEQAMGKIHELDEASDVYGIGATLYYLVTQKPPIVAGSTAAAVVKATRGDFPEPSQLNPALPREVEAIILKAMSTDPRRRYTSARAMAEEIDRYFTGDTVRAVYEVFATAVRSEQDEGWRVRRRVVVACTNQALLESLGNDRVARYEATAASSLASALDELCDEAVDALVVTDELPLDAVLELLHASRDTHPDAARIALFKEPPGPEGLARLVNEVGIDALILTGRQPDPLGDALDAVLRGRDEAPLSGREEARRLRRQLRSVQESLMARNADLEAKAKYLSEKLIELERVKRALVSVSSELYDKSVALEAAKRQLAELEEGDGECPKK